MQDDILLNPSKIVKLENYNFSGLDASLIGAIKSVINYYELPISTSWIYGMTGYAFLHVLDEGLVKPNAGPPEPEIFKLTRNIGVEINGFHVYAEGEEFKNLQAEAWEKAKLAINSKQPVFAKNIDIQNQTSVVYAYDDIGYYTKSWHTGYEHSEEVLPWKALGFALCPCINCVNSRNEAKFVNPTGGLISLHWARLIEAVNEKTALKEALEFIIRLNEEGIYNWEGNKYFIGQKAYERWLTAMENNKINKYYFSLFVEILNEGRHHAVTFLTEIKEKIPSINEQLINEAISTYSEIASRYKILNSMYPYEEPPVIEMENKEQCVAIVKELMSLEEKALNMLKKIHACLP
ncbi:hypothetical protein ACFFF5_06285 [Lederbergia wuyishanensis]|uniref:Uncharacterized protein n=1 Tax=Lederbergia wuyishanensis TaxID=1347903 RepID=A0ABU0D2X1_9BACI|nr:hypothetical protein [Lederbergia wuyishanensis]MCJ8007097.1 hypothetical protein [Lederbergia wuyishanensis]MDQ0342758.1 hypothetical protein [Lederbergia wuyishanensis]